MKKIFSFLVLAGICGTLAACGGNGSSSFTEPSTEGKEEPSDSPEAAAGSQTVPTERPGETEETTPAADTVYVSDGGEGDGSSADSPLGSLADAVQKLESTGGTVVLCGDVSLKRVEAVPAVDGDLLITGRDGRLLVLYSLEFANGKKGHTITLEDLTIVNKLTTDSSKIICNYNNMVFGDRLAVEGNKHYPIIYEGIQSGEDGTQEEVSYEGDASVYIGSGTWESYIGGNYRAGDQSAIGIHRGAMNLEIAGGTFLDTQAASYAAGYVPGSRNQNFYSTSFVGMNFFDGDVNVTISGGSFEGPVFAVGRYGDVNKILKYAGYVRRGDINVEITGGSFSGGEITALQPSTASAGLLRGNYSLSIGEGVALSDGMILSAECVKPYEGETGAASLSIPTGANVVLRAFDLVNGAGQEESEPMRIAFIGDSITYGTGGNPPNMKSFPAQLQLRLDQEGRNVIVGNFGVNGARVLKTAKTCYGNFLFNSVSLEEFDPEIVVFALGTNDASTVSGSMDEFRDRYYKEYKELILSYGKLPSVKDVYVATTLHREDSAEDVVVSEVIPIQKRIVEELAEESREAAYALLDLYSLTLEDANGGFYTDGLHPNESGYRIIAECVYDALFEGK